MAWFDPFEWAPPVEYPTDKEPCLVWTDTQQLSIVWVCNRGENDGALCRQDYLVDAVAGTITEQGAVTADLSLPLWSQHITSAQVAPSGHLLIQTETEISG